MGFFLIMRFAYIFATFIVTEKMIFLYIWNLFLSSESTTRLRLEVNCFHLNWHTHKSFSFNVLIKIYFIFYWISVPGLVRRSVAWSSWRKGSDPTTWPRRSVRRCRTFSRPWGRSTPPKQSLPIFPLNFGRFRAKFSWSSRHLVSIDIWKFPPCIVINVQ